jgi:hypothetical protein
MTTLWTLPASNEALAKHEFISVTPGMSSRVNITDTRSIWRQNSAIIFQTGYRIAGTPADVTAVLTEAGVPAPGIEAVMTTAITSDNYETTALPMYQEELEQYREWMRSVTKSNAESPGAKLFDVMTVVNPDIIRRARTVKEAKALGIAPRGGKGRTRTVSLADRLAKVPAGKVLDVSELQTDGTGSRAINPPTRSRKFGSPNLPMVSADLEHYVMAIDMLPGGRDRYTADIDYVRLLFSQTGPIQAQTALLPVGPGAVPPVPIAPTPVVPGPIATQPQIPASPLLTGTAIPQTELITPTRAYPMFTKLQRKKRKEAAEKAKVPVQGLQPRVPVPAPPLTIFAQGGTTSPGVLFTQPTTPLAMVGGEEEEEEEEEGFPYTEEGELSEEEGEQSEEELTPSPMGEFVTGVPAPAVPTVPAPVVPVPTPEVRVPTIPTIPLPVGPRSPTIPTIPLPVGPRSPTIPTIPVPVGPRLPMVPAVPVPAGPRTPIVPTVPIPAGPRTPIVPTIPVAAGPRSPMVLPQIPTPGRQ